jgi:cell shape-determining protein MreC
MNKKFISDLIKENKELKTENEQLKSENAQLGALVLKYKLAELTQGYFNSNNENQ